MIRRFVAVLGFLVVACGGGGGDNGGDGSTSGLPQLLDLPYALDRATADIVAAFGDRNGARAVTLSLDRGYSVQQVVGAGAEKRLAADGRVTAPGGQPEAPSGPPVGRFSALPGEKPLLVARKDLSVAAAAREPLTADLIDEFLDKLETVGVPQYTGSSRAITAVGELGLTRRIVAMAAVGYSVEQITVAILLGARAAPIPGGGSVLIDVATKQVICPEVPAPGFKCDAGEATEALNTFYGRTVTEETPSVPPAQPTGVLQSTGNRVCISGPAPLPALTNATYEKNQYSVCFPRAGGAVVGKVEYSFRSRDDDCNGLFAAVIDMAGTAQGASLSGDFRATSTVTLEGVCRSERAVFDKPVTVVNGTWSGTYEGGAVKVTIPLDPSDPEDTLVIEGRP